MRIPRTMVRFVSLLVIAAACAPALDEPRRIAFGRVVCDWCGMLVGDPRFAAQIVTREGQALVFDDPVCLFRYVADRGPPIAHAWFRDSTATEDVWLHWREVAFAPADETPMDGGLAAVPPGTEGAISFTEASSRALESPERKDAARGEALR